MRFCLLLTLLPLAVAKQSHGHVTSVASKDVTDPTIVCDLLKHKFFNLTYLPNDEGYEHETQCKLPKCCDASLYRELIHTKSVLGCVCLARTSLCLCSTKC